MPYLSQAGADRYGVAIDSPDSIIEFYNKYIEFQKASVGTRGFEKSLGLQILCDTHFNKHKLDGRKPYNYFGYREDLKIVNNHYYDAVMDLCSSPILKEPMGSDKRLFDIFGLTPNDVLLMDFNTFKDLEKRVNKMRIENEKELIERMKVLKNSTAER